MKKILSVLLAAVMFFGMVPAAVLAAGADPVQITAETYADHTSVALGGNMDYKIMPGERVLIDEGVTWTVGEGSNLFVYGYLDVKGVLIVKGSVTAIGAGEVTAKCWKESGSTAYSRGTIRNPERICGDEDAQTHHYFAEVAMPALSKYPGFTDQSHRLRVRYLCSETGGEYDYVYSDVFYPELENPEVPEPKWYFTTVYANPNEDVILKARLNQYLFLYFDFVDNQGKVLKKYDGNRMTAIFNGAATGSVQGVCTKWIDRPYAVELLPTAVANGTGMTYNVWKDSYFLRQERIYIPTGSGYAAYGVNGEISATDQTVRLNYGDEFKFRVAIDDKYSDSAYSVYLVQGYKWNERNHEGTLESLVDEIYIDEDGNPQHFVWKFEDYQDGAQQKAYIDQYGIYHIASVEDEYTIMVTGVVSNETLSTIANIMDTIRNLLNAIKQFFERVKQMLGL